MAGKRIDHAALAANYQNPGDIYEDTKTEGAFTVVEQQVNDNWDDYAAHKSAVTLDHPDASVTTNKLANVAVTTVKIADSAITSAKIADGTIVTGDIADSAITTAKIADLNVTTAKVNDLAITTGKIADAAVTSAKIADGTIVDADINASASISWTKVSKTGSSLANLATRSAGDLNSGTLVVARLPTGIDAANLADGSISNAELQYINSLTGNAQTQLDGKAPSTHVGSNGVTQHAVADGTNAGFMSATDKIKIDTVQTGAEVNQNAFSKIAVAGQSDVDADSKTDTVTLAGGVGITVTTDAVTDTVTITATGTATPGAHAISHITGGTDIIPNAVAGGNAGLFSGPDKTKLDGIAGAAGTAGSATDTVIGNRTIDDTVAAATGADTPTRLLSKLANMIKAITGKASWFTAPRTTLENAVKRDGDTTSGGLGINNTTGRQLSTGSWGDFGANGNGYALLSNNAYTDSSGGAYKYSQTHGGLGARGVQLSYNGGLQYFDTGPVATTADAAFTPTFLDLWHTGKLRINAGELEFFTGGAWRPVGNIQVGKQRPASATGGANNTWTTVVNISGVMGRVELAQVISTGGETGSIRVTIDGVMETISGVNGINFLAQEATGGSESEPVYFYTSLKVEISNSHATNTTTGNVKYRLKVGTA